MNLAVQLGSDPILDRDQPEDTHSLLPGGVVAGLGAVAPGGAGVLALQGDGKHVRGGTVHQDLSRHGQRNREMNTKKIGKKKSGKKSGKKNRQLVKVHTENFFGGKN